jgi:hypothetical protein
MEVSRREAQDNPSSSTADQGEGNDKRVMWTICGKAWVSSKLWTSSDNGTTYCTRVGTMKVAVDNTTAARVADCLKPRMDVQGTSITPVYLSRGQP